MNDTLDGGRTYVARFENSDIQTMERSGVIFEL